MKNPLRLLILLTVLVWTMGTDVQAQAIQASLEQLTSSSTDIVLGEAIQKTSYWNDNRTRIYTDVRIRVDESIKGDADQEAVVTIPGGQIGNTVYEVSEMPVFVEGEEVLVFLWDHPTGKTLVYAGLHGKMEVTEDPRSSTKMLRGAPSEKDRMLSKTGAPGLEIASEVRSLESVLNEVRAYLQHDQ